MPPLRGSFWVLVLYDIAEQINLERLREILGVEPPRREPSFKHPAPEYVRFERPPVLEDCEPVSIASGERFSCRVERLKAALVQPYSSWLSEDYYVIQLEYARDDEDRPMTGAGMLTARGSQIAEIVRGDAGPLSDAERGEALQSSMSYYPNDLLVVGWVAALVYDTPEGAVPAIQLLEYANTQLLEFRHYDDVLTRVLGDVYKMLEHKGGLLRHWRMARQAENLNTMR